MKLTFISGEMFAKIENTEDYNLCVHHINRNQMQEEPRVKRKYTHRKKYQRHQTCEKCGQDCKGDKGLKSHIAWMHKGTKHNGGEPLDKMTFY